MFSLALPKFLQPNKAKAAVKEEINTLKELLEAQARYQTKRIPIEDGLFQKIREEIKGAVEHFHPSGSSGRVKAMSDAISTILEQHGVSQEQYWGEVWRRSGQKEIISYNKPTGPMASSNPPPEVGPGARITIKSS